MAERKTTGKTTKSGAGSSRKTASSRSKAGASKSRGSSTRSKSSASKSTQRKAQRAPKSRHFEQAKSRAEKVLNDRNKTKKLLDAAERKSEGKKAGRLSQIRAEIKAMLRLVRSYANGDYRSVSWESLVLVAGGLIYLANPLDAIPDFLQPAGYLDDAAVLAFVIGMVADELDDFMEWEKKQGR